MLCITPTQEFDRIKALARRDPAELKTEAVALAVTRSLSMPGNDRVMFPIQAAALVSACRSVELGSPGAVLPLGVGEGKALAHGEPVATPDGWRAVESLRPGDYVCGAGGYPTRVLGVFPQGLRDVWRVTFSDGVSVVCDGDHRWTLQDGHGRRHTRTTAEWYGGPLTRKCGTHRASRLFLPMLTGPACASTTALPLDPYTLGALLGDGGVSTSSAVTFTSADADIVSRLRLPDGVVCTIDTHQNSGAATQYHFVKANRRRSGPNPLLDALRALGLQGRDSRGKFVPPAYVRGSPEDRLELLRGLFDTDGHVTGRAMVEYCTMSAALADAVTEIAQSLGGTAKRTTTHGGAHRLRIKLPRVLNPFTCARKAEPYAERAVRAQRDPFRAVVAIEPAGRAECTCIKVAAADGLFATRGYVLTHNTDVSFVLPYVFDAHRAVLLVPGSLTTSKPGQLGKTERDFRALRAHWKERPYGQVISYERLGRANGGKILSQYRPDLIVCDEAHALRNAGDEGAACAKVVVAYVKAARAAGLRVIFVVMSGTLTGGKLGHMAHLVELALGPRSFLPTDEYDLDMWRRAVDADVEAGGRVAPGCLLDFCQPEDLKGSQLSRARRSIRRRMHETEGVIASTSHRVRSALRLDTIPLAGGVDDATWRALRDDWKLPNDERCLDNFEVHRQARNFSCGYWGDWDPPPPPEWRTRRKRYAKCVRAAIKSRLCNTEVEARAILQGTTELAEWLEIRGEYDPTENRVAHWLSSATLEACATWAKRNKSGIIWTQHIPFGERLERDYGIPYYREEGLNSSCEYIEQATAPVICASVKANGTGRNLQHQWANNLIHDPFGSAEQNEQTIGRTHRHLQKADTVRVDFLVACREHVKAIGRAVERAHAIALMTDNPQKLVYGDWVTAPEAHVGDGWQWRKGGDNDEDEDDLDGMFDDIVGELMNDEANDEGIQFL